MLPPRKDHRFLEGGGIDPGLVRLQPEGVEAPADWAGLASPEIYPGYERAVGFASPGGVVPDTRQTYSAPAELLRNQWALAGAWRIGPLPALLNEPGGAISYQFHARDLHLVMGPPAKSPPVRFRVLLDGEPLGRAHGVDVDEGGEGTADYQRVSLLGVPPGCQPQGRCRRLSSGEDRFLPERM